MAATAATSCWSATDNQNTLLQFSYNPEHKAERGRHGEGSNRTGARRPVDRSAVPVGTVVYDEATGERLFDFTEAGPALHRGARRTRRTRQRAVRDVDAPGADRARTRAVPARSGGCAWS